METVAHAKQGRGTAWLLGSACALAVALVVGIAIGPAGPPWWRVPLELLGGSHFPAIGEAPYVLDGLLYHQTGLTIEEHYTDTGGASDHVFGLMPFFPEGFGQRGLFLVGIEHHGRADLHGDVTAIRDRLDDNHARGAFDAGRLNRAHAHGACAKHDDVRPRLDRCQIVPCGEARAERIAQQTQFFARNLREHGTAVFLRDHHDFAEAAQRLRAGLDELAVLPVEVAVPPAVVTAIAMSRNIMPTSICRNTTGRNTATVVSVDARIAPHTSRPPSYAAWNALLPMCR